MRVQHDQFCGSQLPFGSVLEWKRVCYYEQHRLPLRSILEWKFVSTIERLFLFGAMRPRPVLGYSHQFMQGQSERVRRSGRHVG